MSIEANLKKIVTIDTTAKLNPKNHTLFKLELFNLPKILNCINLSKPYDVNFNNTMIETGIECFNTFGFSLCYVGTHTICYFLKHITKEEENNGIECDFSGKIQKMISIISGKISVIFNGKLRKYFPNENLTNCYPYFECKLSEHVNFDEVVENLNECILQTYKNSKKLFIDYYLPGTDLSSKEAIKKILSDKQIDFNDVTPTNKFGSIIIFVLSDFTKDIKIQDQVKSIKFIKKIPVTQNFTPNDIINIKLESLV